MPFDPDAYLSSADGGFDPDAYLGNSGVWTRPQEGAPPEDVGPPSDGVPLAAKNPQHIGAWDAFASQAGEGVAGIPQAALVAGIGGAEDALLGKRADLLAKYQAMREQQKQQAALGRKEHPWLSLGGRVMSGVGELAGLAAALPEQLGAAATDVAIQGGRAISPYVGALGDTLGLTGMAMADNYARSGQNVTLEQAAQQGVKDAAVGAAAGTAVDIGSGLLKRGINGIVGNAAQVPQRVMEAAADKIGGTRVGQWIGKDADAVGSESRAIRDLKTAQQSYLTESGKQGAEATLAVSGVDLPSRLAKAATEGRASLGPGGFTASPKEFGDDLYRMSNAATEEAAYKIAPRHVLSENPVAELRAEAGKVAPRIDLSHKLYDDAEDLAKYATRARQNEMGYTLNTARSTYAKWQQAKQAQELADAGSSAAANAMERQRIGRGVIEGGIGKAMTAAGIGLGGIPGFLATAVGLGKTPGRVAMGAIDMAGNWGERLAKTASMAERWATQDGNLGKMARWALSGEPATQAARLAALASSEEAQRELLTWAKQQAQ